jgi:DNA polymerase III subunit epsilon
VDADFVVIDVETANPDLSSICQVGIASFQNGNLLEAWESLVNPEDNFSPFNISIHGIDETRVRNAPNWRNVFPQVALRLEEMIVVSHTPFDRAALGCACLRSNLTEFECRWLDSARVARIAWPECASCGYGLSKVAAHLGIKFRAHDALEDARCAGLMLLRAIENTGLSPEEWLVRVTRPIHSPSHVGHSEGPFPAPVKRAGNPEGKLFGEVVVFTGSLSISREQAAEAAANAGCSVDNGVTKHTTILVVGDQDLRLLARHDKSSKQRKAELLVSKGQHIRIVGESDLNRIVSCSEPAGQPN